MAALDNPHMIMKFWFVFGLLPFVTLQSSALPSCCQPDGAVESKVRVMVLDGRNPYHGNWPEWTPVILDHLSGDERFEVEHVRCPAFGESLEDWNPDFGNYDVVISLIHDPENWPNRLMEDFEYFMKEGGGLVVIHAADNSFPKWAEYNRMVGLGGWEGRNEKDGPYVYLDDEGNEIRDMSPGIGGAHGPQHAFEIINRQPEHPVMQGVPERWTHTKDELYDRLRGPAENMLILATAYSCPSQDGTGRHEPVLMAIEYGKGRIFHNVLGHSAEALKDPWFAVTLRQGTWWAAGK
jgi:uncharacterized protein